MLVFALALVASDLGLDLLLGGFAAGLITRQVVSAREVPVLDSKLTAVAFGVFVPFFFVVSGMRLDVDALFSSWSGVGKLAIFFVLFLVVRGTPAMLLYRGVLPLREDRQALALFTATQLPLVVAITTVAVDAGQMLSSTAAALIGAGALSTLAGPLHGLRMRRIARSEAGGRRGVSHRARPPRGPTRRPRPAPAHLAQLGDVAPGAGHQRWRDRGWRSSCRSSTSTPASGGLPIGRSAGRVDLQRPRRRHDHLHRHRVLRGLRRRADPDVVLLPAAGRAAPPRPGDHRRPRAADRHGHLLARSRSRRSATRPTTRAAISCPSPPCCSGCCSRSLTLGAFVALVQRAFESTQIGGILRT